MSTTPGQQMDSLLTVHWKAGMAQTSREGDGVVVVVAGEAVARAWVVLGDWFWRFGGYGRGGDLIVGVWRVTHCNTGDKRLERGRFDQHN